MNWLGVDINDLQPKCVSKYLTNCQQWNVEYFPSFSSEQGSVQSETACWYLWSPLSFWDLGKVLYCLWAVSFSVSIFLYFRCNRVWSTESCDLLWVEQPPALSFLQLALFWYSQWSNVPEFQCWQLVIFQNDWTKKQTWKWNRFLFCLCIFSFDKVHRTKLATWGKNDKNHYYRKIK